MNRRLRQTSYAALALLVGGYAFSHLTGSQGISALLEKRRQIQALDLENQRLREENKKVAEYIEDLKSNPDLQRKLVRERLHYVDEGAIDFKTPPEQDADPTTPKTP